MHVEIRGRSAVVFSVTEQIRSLSTLALPNVFLPGKRVTPAPALWLEPHWHFLASPAEEGETGGAEG